MFISSIHLDIRTASHYTSKFHSPTRSTHTHTHTHTHHLWDIPIKKHQHYCFRIFLQKKQVFRNLIEMMKKMKVSFFKVLFNKKSLFLGQCASNGSVAFTFWTHKRLWCGWLGGLHDLEWTKITSLASWFRWFSMSSSLWVQESNQKTSWLLLGNSFQAT